MILSSGYNDYTLPGKNHKFSVLQNLERTDLSGQTSTTETVSAGNKAKEISCSLILSDDRENDLLALSKIAEDLENNGDPKIYGISHRMCNALNIKQVIFSGTLSIKENETLRVWNISFKLKEHKSVSEKKESRERADEVKVKTNDGKTITGSQLKTMLENVIDTIKWGINEAK